MMGNVYRLLRVPQHHLVSNDLVFTGTVAGENFPDILLDDDELNKVCCRKT